jgi:hypothetical protein
MTFSIRVYRPTGASSREPALVPASLDVRPLSWDAVAKGGYWSAEIPIYGPLDELTGLTSWLGYNVEIVNDRGTIVWCGDVTTVEITAGGLRKGITLDRMANRVQLRYSQKQTGGGVESVDTAWTDDTLSQAAYGVWERRITPERDLMTNEATAMQATALATLANPHYTLAPDSGEQSARLICSGYWQRNKREYHYEARGLAEHNTSGTAYPLGLGIVASTAIAFANRASTITAILGYFKNFASDMRVKVTGASVSGNNQTYTVTGTDDRDAATYVSSAVTFSPADDVVDANGGLGHIQNDDVFRITIAGSATTNPGTHIMNKAGAVAVEVSGSYHATIVSEAAGPAVTFWTGNSIKVTPTPADERAGVDGGGTITATVWGQRYYQTFSHAAGALWTVDTVELRLRKVGSPADNVTVQLYTDSAGAPNTLLKTATVAAASIPTEMDWVSFDFDNLQQLTSGTTYGLVVSRSGANSPTDYYEIDLDESAGYASGTCTAYDGAAYQALSPACDMVFRVLGGIDTGQQIANILEAQSWTTFDTVTTSVVSNQYRNGELPAFDELETLLDTGTSAGVRLLARTTPTRGAVVYAKTDKSTARYAWQDGAKLTDLFGQDAEPGTLPAGEWVKLGDAATLGPWAALSPAFVERAEYNANSGWSLEPEGAADPFDTGTVQG